MTAKPTVRATTYTVSCIPEGMHDLTGSLFDIQVEYAGHGRWAVRWMRRCLDAYLQWDFESIPSEREDDWLDAHRFPLDVALDLAKAAAPHLNVKWPHGCRDGGDEVTHWLTLDDWDRDGIPKRVRCDCSAGEDHHQADCTCPEVQPYGSNPVPPTAAPDCPVHAAPSPIQPWQPLTDEDKRKVDEWLADFIKTLPVQVDPLPAKPLTPEDIREAMRKIRETGYGPPRRTESIKLTPGQWAVLPHGDPRIPTDGRIGDIAGVPVVLVDSDEKSTPHLEGWGKPKRRWWHRLLWWKRGSR